MTSKKKITRHRKRPVPDQVESARTWIEIVTKIIEECSRPGVMKLIITSAVLAISQFFPTGEPAVVWQEVRAWVMAQTSAQPKR